MTHIPDAAVEAGVLALTGLFNGVKPNDKAEVVRVLLTAALPHLTGWREIESAPDGCVTEDVGIRGESEWFYGRTAPEFRKQGAAPIVVIKRRAWPHEDSWRCNGDAYYAPSYFDAWMPLPPAPEVKP